MVKLFVVLFVVALVGAGIFWGAVLYEGDKVIDRLAPAATGRP
jgi:hypothetical protein